MVNLAKVEAEAKKAAAEAATEVKTGWGYVTSWGGKTTAVISDMLRIFWPEWVKAESVWKAWTWAKRIIAAVIVLTVMAVAWAFSVDLGRLILGGYRSAYTYGRGLEVTPSNVTSSIDKATKNLQATVDALTDRIAKLEADQRSIDDKIDQTSASKITTGSITKKRKPAAKSSSSFFNLP